MGSYFDRSSPIAVNKSAEDGSEGRWVVPVKILGEAEEVLTIWTPQKAASLSDRYSDTDMCKSAEPKEEEEHRKDGDDARSNTK